MRVRNRRANLPKKPEPFVERKIFFAGVIGQRFAAHKIHYEIRQTVRSRAAVEKFRDIWMIEIGENLPLKTKAANDFVGVESAFD